MLLILVVLAVGILVSGSGKVAAGPISGPLDENSTDIQLRFDSAWHLTVTINGTDYLFYDRNPYDDGGNDHNYALLDDGGCDASITFNKDAFNSTGNLSGNFELNYQYLEGTGTRTCSDRATLSFAVNEAHANRHYNAYWIDENNLYMPRYRVGTGCDSVGNAQSATRDNGVFRTHPDPERAGYNPNRYFLIGTDGSYNGAEQSGEDPADRNLNTTWINTNGGDPNTAIEGQEVAKRFCSTFRKSGQDVRDITIAPRNVQLPERYRSEVEAYGFTFADDGSVSGSPDSAEADDVEAPCPIQGTGVFGWILCPFYELAQEAAQQMAEYMNRLLNYTVDEKDSSGNDTAVKIVWSRFRDIANVLFVVAFLAMILSQTIGGRL